mmetsp:Transcript_11374/g.19477  ORF Transcript_11374/g.19477 Transcript_11374/m.19477 type:complete len:96 (-) Transcript_11374:321-608(-)
MVTILFTILLKITMLLTKTYTKLSQMGSQHQVQEALKRQTRNLRKRHFHPWHRAQQPFGKLGLEPKPYQKVASSISLSNLHIDQAQSMAAHYETS